MGANALVHTKGLPDLRHVSDDRPGWSRRRRGRGFSYHREDGSLIRDPLIKARFNSLAIPPAWTDVWLCPLENGHLLSTGRDEAGRKQYRYHPDWLAYQQLNKFNRLVGFAEALPATRILIRNILQDRERGWDRERVAALAIALMDETGMRVGNSSYRKRNGTVGLTTLRRKHVDTDEDGLHFEYVGKSGKDRSVDLTDPQLIRLVRNVSELPGYEIFRYRQSDGSMSNLDSRDINDMVHELMGPDYSSKYFRTWAGTSAAVHNYWLLREQGALTDNPVLRVVELTAAELGNTVAVCRKYYIHPAILSAIETSDLPGPDTITEQEQEEFGEEFDDEEIIAYRMASTARG